ncbi:MAG: hypothetical protein L3K08_05555 [Thermoplasmata archaeon]|nr:hypothetical protein [Thermoplasmata archaeon]
MPGTSETETCSGANCPVVAGLYTIFVPSDRPGRLRYGTGLTVVGTLMGFLAPILVAVAQPSALTADTHGASAPSTGPWVSFIGSDSVQGMTITWGPTYGWYLALAAGALLLVAAFLFGRQYAAQKALENPEVVEGAPYAGDSELYGSSGPYQAPESPAEPPTQ